MAFIYFIFRNCIYFPIDIIKQPFLKSRPSLKRRFKLQGLLYQRTHVSDSSIYRFIESQAKGQAMKRIFVFSLFLLFCSAAFAQSVLNISKLEKKDIAQANTNVGLSALLEGDVASRDAVVYVMVYEPHLKAHRFFPAAVDQEPQNGKYHWRAICRFGEHDGTGIGATYQARAVAFDPNQVKKNGLPAALPSSVANSSALILKRVK
jgi:hypothetical protein